MITWLLSRTSLIKEMRAAMDEMDASLTHFIYELDQAEIALSAMTEDRDALAEDLENARADYADAEREIDALTIERDMALDRIEGWESTRTTGGPARGFTHGWRNRELPRVETAAPLEAET